MVFACIGFDTESKPTFKVGEVSSGPHLIQFATPAKAYLFRISVPGCIEAASAILQAPALAKIGFGLKSDRSRLHGKLRSEEHTSELQSLMRTSYAVFCLKKKNKPTTTQHT